MDSNTAKAILIIPTEGSKKFTPGRQKVVLLQNPVQF